MSTPWLRTLAAAGLVLLAGLPAALAAGDPAAPEADGQERPAEGTGDDGAEKAPPEPPKKKLDGTFEIPGTEATLKVGGYVKLDLIHDFDAIGSEDKFDLSSIPTDGSDGENTHLHAKQSRLNLDFRRPTRRGPARIFTEVDFFGSGNTLRLRHAYGSVGPLLVGQTWSTFMDEDAIPPTLDFEEPRSYIFVRQALVRWTWRTSDRFLLALALEEPDAEIDAGGVSGSSEDPYPDFTYRARWTAGGGHVQLSGFAGLARFRSDAGAEDDETIWGINLSGNLAAGARDRFRFQLAYGDGLTRYRGALAVATDENGRLEAIPAAAFMVSYQHFWSDRLSSHLVYSYGDEDNTAGQGPDAIEAIEYGAFNLVWQLAERISLGAEWLYGSREDSGGASGDANRLQLAFKLGFF